MKGLAGLVCAACLFAGVALAQSPVTLTIGDQAREPGIPAGFSGLSFETMLALPDAHRQRIFSRTNKPLIALFKTLGVRSLRLGGNTADMPKIAVPGAADIDSLF